MRLGLLPLNKPYPNTLLHDPCEVVVGVWSIVCDSWFRVE